MALTKEYQETIVARIKRDRKFALALYSEAINALLEGETAGGLSMLRDLVHAEITFKELARQTGLGEKTLHRMLNRQGNPTTRNLGVIVRSIAGDLGIKPRVKLTACKRELAMIPKSFKRGMADAEAGRFADMETVISDATPRSRNRGK